MIDREVLSQLSRQNQRYKKLNREFKEGEGIKSINRASSFRSVLENHVIKEGMTAQRDEGMVNKTKTIQTVGQTGETEEVKVDLLEQAMLRKLDTMTDFDIAEFQRVYDYLISDIFRYEGDNDWSNQTSKMITLQRQLGVRYGEYLEGDRETDIRNSLEYQQQAMELQSDVYEYSEQTTKGRKVREI